MILDKKISLGTIITLVTILGTFIFTQGATTTKIESIESEGRDSRKRFKAIEIGFKMCKFLLQG